MNRIFIYILIMPLLLMLLTHNVMGQQSECKMTLSGKVIDEHDDSNLEFATIYIKEIGRGVSADEYGEYRIAGICPGIYTIRVSHVSCQTREEKVEIFSDLQKNLLLEHHVLGLEEVRILGTKIRTDNTKTKSFIGEEELVKNTGKSLGETMKSLTGVTTLQSGPTISKPVIHGMHSNRVAILNNGVRQEGQQWGAEHAPEIDPNVASKITVIKGAEAVRFGADAIGGIILIESADLMERSGLAGGFNMAGFSNGRKLATAGRLEGGFDSGIGWRVQSSYNRSGDATAPDYNLSNTGLKEFNFSGTIGYQKNNLKSEVYYSRYDADIAILRSAHIGNLTDLLAAINSDRPLFVEDFSYKIDNPRQEVTHHLIKARLEKKFSNRSLIKWQYGYQINSRNEFDRRRGENFNRPSIALDLLTHTSKLILEHQSKGFFSGELGLSGIWQRNKNKEGTNATFLIPDYKSYGIGAHWILRYVKDRYELEVGTRFDHRMLKPLIFDREKVLQTPDYAFNNVTLTAGVVAKMGSHASIRTNLATSWRPPHVSELFSNGLHHGAAAIEEGLLINNGTLVGDFQDVDLKAEKAFKWISSFEYNDNRLEIEVGPYFSRVNNYIYLRPKDVRLTIRGAFPVFHYVQTDAEFIGVDLNVKYAISSALSLNSKGSFLRATDISQSDVLIYIPANNVHNSLNYRLNDMAGFEDFNVSVEVATVFRQNRAPEVYTDFQNSEIPESIFDLKDAPDAYSLLNLDIGFTKKIARQPIQFGINIQNVLNVSYRDYMNRYRYFTDDPGRNITLRINYKF